MRIKRSQQRSGGRAEEVAGDVEDGAADQLDDVSTAGRANGSGEGLDGAGLSDHDADLPRDPEPGPGAERRDGRDLDDDAPVRRGPRRTGGTMIDERLARPRAPQTATMREGFHPRQFLHEVNVEMRKVAWPTRKETVNYSTVVFVALALLMAMVFGLDYLFNNLSIFLFK